MKPFWMGENVLRHVSADIRNWCFVPRSVAKNTDMFSVNVVF